MSAVFMDKPEPGVQAYASPPQRRSRSLMPIPVLGLLALAVLAADIMTPKGTGAGALYVIVVVASLAWRDRATVLWTTTVCTLLAISGWLLAPAGSPMIYAIPSRCIAVFVLWVVALLGLRHARTEIELKQSLHRQRALAEELYKQVRTNLAGLLSLCDAAASQSLTPEQLAERTRARLEGLLAVHALLTGGGWKPAGIREVVHAIVPTDRTSSVRLEGPALALSPRQAPGLGMALRELISESMRAGAMSVPGGRVDIAWTLQREGRGSVPWVDVVLLETGGPSVNAEDGEWSASRLVEGIAGHELGGTFSVAATGGGSYYRLRFPLEQVPGRDFQLPEPAELPPEPAGARE